MKILIATSEAIPFIKTGGLADVTGTLVDELNGSGIRAAIILPFYRKIRQNAQNYNIRPLGIDIKIPLGSKTETAGLWKGETPGGAPAYFIENDKFYDRDDIYGTSGGDFPDNVYRFTFFNRAVCEAINTLGLTFDIIHCNDWQTGLIPVYIKTLYRDAFRKTATIITIHNLGFQGLFSSADMPITGLGWELFNSERLEFYGKINFLKGGILFADLINTVSSNYAKEILTKDYGCGLDGVLKTRNRDIYGIINGINYKEWNPGEDRLIPAYYSRNDLSGKEQCKKTLLRTCGLPAGNALLIGLVTRFSSQKGLALVAEASAEIINSGINVIMLGKGDDSLQNTFLSLGKKFSKQMSVTIGFDNVFAHKIYAGSDVFLMPSSYEPCGLGQLIALRYGTIPVVRKTGGLVDTIKEYNSSEGSGTGFLFDRYSSDALISAIKRAQGFFRKKQHWLKIQKNAMSQDFSWHKSAKQYISLYKKTLTKIR